MNLNDLTVIVSKTADGKSDYMQIMSRDMVSINVVFVAPKIELEDTRGRKVKK